jgi:hypothetical protein
MPIQGLKFNISTGTEAHQSFQSTGSFTAYNPNDGYALVALDRTATLLDYDHKLPSQSGGQFPGPINSYLSIYYVDQSGSGIQGQLIVYGSPQQLQIPHFWSIGRAIQSQVTSVDLIQGTQPGNPPFGSSRLWVDGSGNLQLLASNGTNVHLIDTNDALGGVLSGFLPNPGLASTVNGNISTWSGLLTANGGITSSATSQFFADLITANVGVQAAVVAGKVLTVHGQSQFDNILAVTGGGIDVTGTSFVRSAMNIVGGGLLLQNTFVPTPQGATVSLGGRFGAPVGGGVAPAPTLRGTGFGAGFGFIGWWEINVNGTTCYVPYYS